ncbi:tetratricopeptide repeat protein [Helicobacter baculiformis]|uniref:Tetratricopeptide repeat protein n=1 Tax=Helicobacter baculiformis TaxID=427351 RepID=A0ABV7ZJ20_9HELI|nr:hypothetical protein [Helicobacter baculiformis]
MEQLAYVYKDSLFSVALLIAAIGAVILFDHFRSLVKHKKNLKALNTLSCSYASIDLDFEVQQLLAKEQESPSEVLGIQTWLFLAKHYSKHGSAEQAITIYLALLSKYPKDRVILLKHLAQTYIAMGYVQKAHDILIEVLRIEPRNVNALKEMVRVYEMLCAPQKALEVLECLDALETEGLLETYHYLQMQVLMQEDLSLEDRSAHILALGHKYQSLYKLALGHCKTYHRALFLQELPRLQRGMECVDLLWDLEFAEIQPLLAQLSPEVREIFMAKGFIEGTCGHWQLEVFQTFKHKYPIVLNFSYQCNACKNLSPFESYRCVICGVLGVKEVVLSLNTQPTEYSQPLNLN